MKDARRTEMGGVVLHGKRLLLTLWVAHVAEDTDKPAHANDLQRVLDRLERAGLLGGDVLVALG